VNNICQKEGENFIYIVGTSHKSNSGPSKGPSNIYIGQQAALFRAPLNTHTDK